jgi:hypothetical protein
MHAPTVTKILNYVCVCVVCVMSSPEIHAAGSGGSPNMHWLSLAPAGVAGPAGVTCRRARLNSRLKAERIYLPKEPAGAAVRAPSALDVPADWLLVVNSAYHSVFTFLVRVERIYSDSWLSSSLAAKLLRGVTRPSADVYSNLRSRPIVNSVPTS